MTQPDVRAYGSVGAAAGGATRVSGIILASWPASQPVAWVPSRDIGHFRQATRPALRIRTLRGLYLT